VIGKPDCFDHPVFCSRLMKAVAALGIVTACM
jgi:hypothetical protein